MDLPDNVHVLPRSALVRTFMTVLRNKRTPSDQFRAAGIKLARLVVAPAMEEEPVEEFPIRTPIKVEGVGSQAATGFRFQRGNAAVVPILRAGNAFLDPFAEVLPNPRFWHLGLSRNHKTLKPREYSNAIPKRVSQRITTVYVADPMFATGGSVDYAVSVLKARGARRIVYVGMVGVPEAIELMHKNHPDVPIYLASLEGCLNAHGYIERDGIGDFGDRFHNSL